ncbi:MAG: 3'(2'),5'-bisphosphate nucleotidase [Anaerolineae bacterium]|jgi:3'(2'), 5'-bisphosphate nucleotidase|nr:3'(2'),5'-bisphosphate nucleotidase [Anaerolineae bacterium]MBT3712625.1 3'(2'),5'-bisphosphate nucleotidase [Anaerolineae bacterium]MBT4457321.1 3'(2'),5'-bisphosphate nucleotidase [Anaerolineae bacterium]MBT4842864.1 3'(2'),5'-bisphosphate nucleotidase [Anaerolineae bacterium]MBT6062026.1 3'(2'),5'-bisphosphate nucleotidase [Anaerolineae bacterium]
MFNINNPEVKFAINAVRQAAELVKTVQTETAKNALTKGDKSPVTVADFASQALVSHMLMQEFPDAVLVGEEASDALKEEGAEHLLEAVTNYTARYIPESEPDTVCEWIDRGAADATKRFWTLDPIDGTKGFIRGDQYAVALALVEDGEVQIGVLGCPNLTNGYISEPGGTGTLVIAVRGQGTWLTGMANAEKNDWQRIQTSPRANPSEARLMRSFESGHTDVSKIDEISSALGVEVEPVRMDSQAKYAVLAVGKGEVILRLLSPKMPNYQEKIWDQAAGSIVLEEAGGCISDLDGKPLDFSVERKLINNRGVLATNGLLHEAALKALRDVGA